MRKTYPAARHYCYAWKLGSAGETTKSSDDGEPAGTAGKPILGQITAAGITNACVIVARYFGGTLLGTGGLHKAYRNAAGGAINNAETAVEFVMSHFRAVFGDSDMGQVMRVLRDYDARITNADYDSSHSILFEIKKMQESELAKKFEQLYRVRLEKLTT